ncbi:phage regulatory protein/antirepressor Ant [Fusobacterium massiliense]|uniref:phage regulatory protein/antirepressor Ant n=1 Tax=Fusobacterium massiliense TaxID=1852365 RepID=UPI0028D86C17|nr:phage regulatory protein/antirepressor Ant [Fusobacterium massiliense]
MDNLNLVKVENINGVLVTTSNRVAEELGVRHDHLLDKIDDYVFKFNSPELSGQFYIPHNYKDRSGKTNRNYLITKKGVAQLVGGYSAAVERAFELNVAYINEFERMENYIKGSFQLPTSFAEALRLAADQQEQLENLKVENETQKQIIGELKPIKEYVDTILSSDDTMTITQIAADYGLSGMRLNQILHQERIIRNVGGQWLLYTDHMNKGYTKSETIIMKKKDGTDKAIATTKWTQKGRLKIHNILTSLDILANMDKEKKIS